MQTLGFTVNEKKSVLIPTQRIVFFGFIIDSVEFKVYLTEEKLQKLLLKTTHLLHTRVTKIRELASVIGLIVSCFHAVLEAPLHYRSLERDKIRGLGKNMNYENNVDLSEASCLDLTWWIKNVRLKNGKSVRPNQVEHYCWCDASLCGWGSIELSTSKHANGRWGAKEAKLSINILELLAIYYSLQSFYNKLVNTHIQIESDNVSAIKYMNDVGGMTCNVMDSIAKEIWEWCVKRNLFVSAVHVPGIENTADFFSRNFSDSTEWMLKTDIFKRVCLQFFKPDIDLFASRLNRQLDMFVSWFPEPGAYHVNAFSSSWSGICPYIFLPFGLLGKVINKVKKEGVEKAIVIFPLWRSQSWFPMLIEVLSDFPVKTTQAQRLTDSSTQWNGTPISTENHYGRCSYIRKSLEGQGLLRCYPQILEIWNTQTV